MTPDVSDLSTFSLPLFFSIIMRDFFLDCIPYLSWKTRVALADWPYMRSTGDPLHMHLMDQAFLAVHTRCNQEFLYLHVFMKSRDKSSNSAHLPARFFLCHFFALSRFCFPAKTPPGCSFPTAEAFHVYDIITNYPIRSGVSTVSALLTT